MPAYMKLKISVNILCLFTCFLSFSQDNLHSSLTINPELKKSANAVVRLSDVTLEIKERRAMSISLKRIVTVLNEKGNRFVQAYVGYDKYRKIKKIEALIYNESGEEIKKIKKRDFIDQSAVDGGTLYSDSRVLYMSYLPITYPYTVEFTYQMDTPNTAAIPSWGLFDGYYVSVEKDIYTIKDLANLGLRSKMKRFDSFNVEVNENSRLIEFKAENVKALKPESLSPTLSKLTPFGMVAVERFHYNGVDGQAKNWAEFGDWIENSLLKGRNTVTAKTKGEILNLVKGIEDPIEKAKIVYQFVQDNTRYISVQVGIGGIQPIPALEVDRLKYGDCKGLTNYTQALLTIADVPSYYSIVQAGPQIVDFDPDFASLQQGNHIILGIPNEDETIWVDCTSQIHPFGFIGDFTDSRNVLLVKGSDSKIIETTSYPDSLNIQSIKAKVTLDIEGNLSSDVVIKTNGIQYDSRFVIERKTDKNILEHYKSFWNNINNLEIEKYNFENDKNRVEFTEKVALSALKYGSINNERLIFVPNIFNKNNYIPDRYRNRKLSFEIQRGYLDIDNFEIVIPENYELEALPEDVEINTDFGRYSVGFSIVEDKIEYTRKLYIKKGAYDKAAYSTYRDFRKKVSKLDNSIIVLKKNK